MLVADVFRLPARPRSAHRLGADPNMATGLWLSTDSGEGDVPSTGEWMAVECMRVRLRVGMCEN